MTIEEHEDVPDAVSENMEVQPMEEGQEASQESQKMVPLAALQAERRKRQEYETRSRVYEDMLSQRNQAEPEEFEDEDPDALVTKSSFRQEKAMTKREILEQVYQDMNPEAVQKINTYLKPILDKKPWLASTLDTAVNRLARANEIVDDYMHLLEDKPKPKVSDAKRLVENLRKPRSPVEVAKSAQLSGTDYLRSIQGTKEFREYRAKVLSGKA